MIQRTLYRMVTGILLPLSLFALTPQELAHSVNLAGKERMLTQKMAKETLLIAHKIDAEANRKALRADADRFEKVLKGLMQGDATLHLVPCGDAAVQQKLEAVWHLWQRIRPHIDAIVAGDADIRDFEAIRSNNLPLLEKMHTAVTALVKKSKTDNSARSQAINLAGKERMLTQMMARALLENDTEGLKNAADQFDRILSGLIDGDPELKLHRTELPAIRTELSDTSRHWREIRDRLFRPLQSPEFRRKSVRKLDALLSQMDNITQMYEKSLQRTKQAAALQALVDGFMQQEQQRRHTINLAGKERMLTQKMTKEALLVTLGIEKEHNKIALQQSAARYDRILNGLIKGDAPLGLEPIRNSATRAAATQLQKEWHTFYRNIETILQSKTKAPRAVAYIVAHNEVLLDLSDRLVQQLKRDAGTTDYLQQAREQIVDIAGKERMLIQKMTKEKLLILAAIHKSENHRKLMRTVAAFDGTLHALLQGDSSRKIPKATNPQLRVQLQKVLHLWQKLKPLYETQKLDKKGLATILSHNTIMLQEMDRAVTLYEQLTEI